MYTLRFHQYLDSASGHFNVEFIDNTGTSTAVIGLNIENPAEFWKNTDGVVQNEASFLQDRPISTRTYIDIQVTEEQFVNAYLYANAKLEAYQEHLFLYGYSNVNWSPNLREGLTWRYNGDTITKENCVSFVIGVFKAAELDGHLGDHFDLRNLNSTLAGNLLAMQGISYLQSTGDSVLDDWINVNIVNYVKSGIAINAETVGFIKEAYYEAQEGTGSYTIDEIKAIIQEGGIPSGYDKRKLVPPVKHNLNVSHCFAQGTEIKLADGRTVAIEQIKEGDHVLAYSGLGALESRKVLSTFSTPEQEVVEFEGVRVTLGHSYLLADGSFRPLGEIGEDDTLVLEDGTPVPFSGTNKVPGRHTVYNFTVEGLHTYIAGGYRVHNDSRYVPQSTGGAVGSFLAAQLVNHFGSDNVALKIVETAAAKTVGGYIGDAIFYKDGVRPDYLPTRFGVALYKSVEQFVGGQIGDAISGALGIRNQHAKAVVGAVGAVAAHQIGTSVLAAVYNANPTLFSQSALKAIGVQFQPVGLIEDAAGNVIGVDYVASGADLWASVKNIGLNMIASYAGSQLAQAIFDGDPVGANIGSSIGSFIGGIISGGNPIGAFIGSFIGSALGGIIGDIFGDEDFQRAGVKVGIGADGTFELIRSHDYVQDDGSLELAVELAGMARDTLNLYAGAIGGVARTTNAFYYGHYIEQFHYQPTLPDQAPGGSSQQGRVLFAAPEDAITQGVLAQLRTVQIEGGDRFMKRALSLSAAATLDELGEDLRVAGEYGVYADNPLLFENALLDEDAGAAEFSDAIIRGIGEMTSAEARMAFIDSLGDDFTVQTGDATANTLAGTDEVDDGLVGGDGDDILIGAGGADALLGDAGADDLQGGQGDDVYYVSRGDGADTIYDDYRYEDTWQEPYTVTIQEWVVYSDEFPGVVVARYDYRVNNGIGEYLKPPSGAGEDYDPGGWRPVYIPPSGEDDGHYIAGQLETREETHYNTVTGIVQGDGGSDVLQFGQGIALSDLIFEANGDDLIIGVKDPANPNATLAELSDTITIQDWSNAMNRVETLRFAGGWTVPVDVAVDALSADGTVQGTAGDDFFIGRPGSASLQGSAGDDIYYLGRGAGATTVYDDYRYDEWVDETYTYTVQKWQKPDGTQYEYRGSGESGEYLEPPSGAGESYDPGGWKPVYTPPSGEGDGGWIPGQVVDVEQTGTNSVLTEMWEDGGVDVLRFGAGVSPLDLLLELDGTDLVVGIKDPADPDAVMTDLTDQIRITDWVNEFNRIEQFTFTDGTVLYPMLSDDSLSVSLRTQSAYDWARTKAAALELGLDNAAASDDYIGGPYGQVFAGDPEANTLNGGAEDDVLSGGAGDDTLTGLAGDDMVFGGTGADILQGNQGNDTYFVSRGDGTDTIHDDYRYDVWVDETYTYTVQKWQKPDGILYDYRGSGENGEYYQPPSGVGESYDPGGWKPVYVPLSGEGDGGWIPGQVVDVEQTGTNSVLTEVQEDAGDDMLQFGAGITAANLLLELVGNDLVVGIRDDANPDAMMAELTDVITLQDWTNDLNRIERFRLADGSTYLPTLGEGDVVSLVEASGARGQAITDSDVAYGPGLLVLDLDNDGVDTVDKDLTQALFDLDSDGYLEQMGWIGADDAFLVMDRNADGVIDDLTEFFTLDASAPAGGPASLVSLDSNADGIFDKNDADFENVRAWIDLNQNGVTDLGELVALHRFELTSIAFDPFALEENRNGHNIVVSSNYTRLGQNWTQNGHLYDVSFAYNTLGVSFDESDPNLIRADFEGRQSVNFAAGTSALTQTIDTQVSYSITGGDFDDVFTVAATGDPDNPEAGAMLNGMAGNDTLTGGAGNDVLIGGAGSDIMFGGAGDDVMTIDGDDLLANVDGGEGYDVVVMEGNSALIMDLAVYNFEVAVGGDGDDALSTSGLSGVVLAGGAGDDYLSGSADSDKLEGGAGEDTLVGGDGDDLLIGGAGVDSLHGGAGNDHLKIDSEDLSGSIDGGDDYDLIIVEDTVGVSLDLGAINVEMAVGGSGDDTFVAGIATSVELVGGKGDDTLTGGSGEDGLLGNEGNDTLQGGGGVDYIDGGDGTDTVHFAGVRADYSIVSNTDGSHVVTDLNAADGDDGVDTVWNAEILQFSDSTIILDPSVLFALGSSVAVPLDGAVDWAADVSGGSGTLVFALETAPVNGSVTVNADGSYTYTPNSGYTGDDSFTFRVSDDNDISSVGTVSLSVGVEPTPLAPGIGADRLVGGAAADSLNGLAGDDLLIGGDGADSLSGDAGADRLEGGQGDDTYVFNRGDGADSVHDDYRYEDWVEETYTYYIQKWQKPDGSLYDYRGSGESGEYLQPPSGSGENYDPGGWKPVYVPLSGEGDGGWIPGQVVDIPQTGTQSVLAEIQGDGGVDTLSFGPGITAADVIVQLSGNDLTVAIRDGDTAFADLTDKIVVQDWRDAYNRVEILSFNDGSTIDLTSIQPPDATAGDDMLTWSASGIDIDGGAGNDTITGSSFADSLAGGDGDDQLSGGTGDDRITGGSGDDTIDGEAGNDIAAYAGVHAGYDIRRQDDGSILVSDIDSADGDDGTDVVSNVEALAFSDITVDITNPPVASDGLVLTVADTTAQGEFGVAAGTGGLVFAVEDGPANGDVQINADGSFTYTPDVGFTGDDSFTYRTTDSNGISDLATIDVNVASMSMTVGGEFQVNTNVPANQDTPSIAALNDGGFIVVWEGSSQDGSGDGIFGQRFDANGVAIDGEFLINTTTNDNQKRPAATALTGGGFVVVWDSYGQDGSANGIFGQRFDTNGNPAGGEFAINTHTYHYQEYASVSALNDGGFVVVWESRNQDGYGEGAYGQRFDAAGNAVGAEFQINVTTYSDQDKPVVTGLSDGGFVIVWEDGSSNPDIFGRQYDANGAPVGSEFQINTNGVTGGQPNVVSLSGGGYVVVFTDNSEVYGQMFDAAGTALGSHFLVNTTTSYDQENASIAALPDGGFVVTWQSDNQDGDDFGVYAQRYDAVGNPIDGEFQLNSYTAQDQYEPVVAALANGGFVITWTSEDQDDPYSRGTFAAIVSLSADQVMTGGGGSDSLTGGPSDDVLSGETGSDLLFGNAGNDTLDGGAGDDLLRGGDGDDSLSGGAGVDDLDGGAGDDTLDGGAGYDIVSGGLGSDVYLFARGSGQDIVFNENEAATSDYVVFGTDIAVDQLWFEQQGMDLTVTIVGTSDQLVIRDWYADAANTLDAFQVADGNTLMESQVEQLRSAMAAFDPPSGGNLNLPDDVQAALDPVIAAAWQPSA